MARIEAIRDARCKVFTFVSDDVLGLKGSCGGEELHQFTISDNMLEEWVRTFECLKGVYPLKKRG